MSSNHLAYSGSRFEFRAMGSPCEIRLYALNAEISARAVNEAVSEINRLENKFSRYQKGNLLYRVNEAAAFGGEIDVDEEFISLLEYAETCYQQSDGLFDITSGVLRSIWDFSAGVIATDDQISEILPRIGWRKVEWSKGTLKFNHTGMELDFGGLVKEYAADSAASKLQACGIEHGMVDLGGDIKVVGPHPSGDPWIVKIRHPHDRAKILAVFKLYSGGLASSGDYERKIEIGGRRYSHIISPQTGWPVSGLSAVTTIADQCVIAGSLCTIAMLKEKKGAQWLSDMGVEHVWMDTEGEQGGSA